MTPFYQKALRLFTRTQENQIKKGLAKYPNAFNPHEWTPEELLNHALEETVDLTHYLVGLKELLDAKDERIRELEKHLALKRGTPETVKMLNDLNVGEYVFRPTTGDPLSPLGPYVSRKDGKSPYDMNFNPHFDQDDQ